MNAEPADDAEKIRKIVARTVASSPAGRGLALIGGFRYRMLSQSARVSDDIDYHWDGDLAEKQDELIRLFDRALFPEIRRLLGYDGRVDRAKGSGADSPAVRVVELSFWKGGVPNSRIEIPVEITRIANVDPYQSCTAEGTSYLTVSENDMVESKVVAILNRTYLEHRDFVDVFLFQHQLGDDARERLAVKLRGLNIEPSRVRERVSDIEDHRDYHAKAIQVVVDEQVIPAVADNIDSTGGGRMILDRVLELLHRHVPMDEDNHESH